jgi:hypothetical protein
LKGLRIITCGEGDDGAEVEGLESPAAAAAAAAVAALDEDEGLSEIEIAAIAASKVSVFSSFVLRADASEVFAFNISSISSIELN